MRPGTNFVVTLVEILKLGACADGKAGPKSFTLQLPHASIMVVSVDGVAPAAVPRSLNGLTLFGIWQR